jgi:hypothetical protein
MSFLSTDIDSRGNHRILALLLIFALSIRITFAFITNLTLEDALITFRYAENLAHGHGFVYNLDKHVLGTSSPLWTIILATLKSISNVDVIIISKFLGIAFDCGTITVLFLTLTKISGTRIAIIFALLFCSNPDLIMISTSGMETSLLLFGMAIGISGMMRKNSFFGFGLVIALLTRIDAIIFIGCILAGAFIIERKWAFKQSLFIVCISLPWFIFSIFYFGNLLPQSLLAKSIAYHQSISLSSLSFIGALTPFNNTNPFKIIISCTFIILLCFGIIQISKACKSLFPLIIFFISYCVIFSLSGMLIFRWYIIPPIFISMVIIAYGFDWLYNATRSKYNYAYSPWLVGLIALILIVSSLSIAYHRLEKYKQLQGLEDTFRKEIGLWLNNNLPHGSSVLLEPIGYIGYYAGLEITIMDEIGIVTPQITQYRNGNPGWYHHAIEELRPEYIIQYKYSLDKNISEGTGTKLFETEGQRKWFDTNYQAVQYFKSRNEYPLIEGKEKEYVLFQKK